MNFPDAVIYRLKCYTTNTYYIGSTIDLNERMRHHKSKKNNTTSKTIIAGDNYGEAKILLSCPCNDKEELFQIEQGFLDTYREKYGDSVLNKYNAYTTEEETREKKRKNCAKWRKNNPEKVKENNAKHRAINPEKIKESSAKYRAENRETIRAYKNEQFKCECGGSYTRARKARHLRTKKHQKFIHYRLNSQKQVCEALSVLI